MPTTPKKPIPSDVGHAYCQGYQVRNQRVQRLQHTLERHSMKNAQAVVSWGGSSASSCGLPGIEGKNQPVETRCLHGPVEDAEGSQMNLIAVEALKSPPPTHLDPSFIINSGCPSRTSSVVFTFLHRQVKSRTQQHSDDVRTLLRNHLYPSW